LTAVLDDFLAVKRKPGNLQRPARAHDQYQVCACAAGISQESQPFDCLDAGVCFRLSGFSGAPPSAPPRARLELNKTEHEAGAEPRTHNCRTQPAAGSDGDMRAKPPTASDAIPSESARTTRARPRRRAPNRTLDSSSIATSPL